MLNRILFKQIDNSALIVFRVFFGLLIVFESFGAILTGWVKRVLVEPEFTFSFISFDWIQPLPGIGMYIYFAIMGIFGFGIMLGYKYRFSIVGFTVMWTFVYLMQKSSYNNHYYLLVFLSLFMAIMPANRYYSIDAKQNPSIIKYSMPQWCSLLFVVQMGIVYTYASVAKWYPDWIDTTAVELFMKGKKNYVLIGDFLQTKWLHYVLAYSGILFDLLVVPLLLYKPTRKLAFVASVFFHLFNSIVFQIGIFPYMSLALCMFFFEPKTIRNIFLKQKPLYNKQDIIIPNTSRLGITVFVIYFVIHILLPLRHWVIKDDVLWTEEGHRLSWRMMLRVKSGYANYKVVNKETGQTIPVKLSDFLTRKQINIASTKPDVIWQFSQYLKSKFKEEGQDVEVYVDCFIKVNGRPFQQLINPEIDLASVKWDAFKHSDWILPSKQD